MHPNASHHVLHVLLLLHSLACCEIYAFVVPPQRSFLKKPHLHPHTPSTALHLMDPTLAALICGSVAGPIGVGVAFPLDTLKTKAQVLGQNQVAFADGGGGHQTANSNMIDLFNYVYAREGIAGFFGGVGGAMLGQAPIYASAFGAKTAAAHFLSNFPIADFAVLTLAACYAGWVASFIVAPVERVKLILQSSAEYENEWECLQAIIRNEGLAGLFQRGLGLTMLREVPGYGIYFVVYDVLMQSFGTELGHAAPLAAGALAGMASWIPVYPLDVVKTAIQNTNGDDTRSAWFITQQLYRANGIGGFFDGLTPKMLRASVSNATIFFFYDIFMSILSSDTSAVSSNALI
jgi:hypothetical protein